MHDAFVEPSKLQADLVVHSAGIGTSVALNVLKNHLKVEAGLL
jgi:hypothetical protein